MSPGGGSGTSAAGAPRGGEGNPTWGPPTSGQVGDLQPPFVAEATETQRFSGVREIPSESLKVGQEGTGLDRSPGAPRPAGGGGLAHPLRHVGGVVLQMQGG